MDEGDLEAKHTVPRSVVDQLGTCLGKVREGRADVGDLVRNVVHPGTSLRKEAAHRRVLVERTEQLEPALTNPDGRSLDTLLLDA